MPKMFGVVLALVAMFAVSNSTSAQDKPRYGSCYSRVYSAQHMREHPDQLVTAMAVKFDRFSPKPDDRDSYEFSILVKTRGTDETWVNSGRCEPRRGKVLWCGIEGDGGQMLIKGRDNWASAYVNFADPPGYGFISLAPASDPEANEDDFFELRAGKDDRVFRLDAAPAGACTEPLKEARRHARP